MKNEAGKEEILQYISMALKIAEENIAKGHGGPFGAVIVKNGEIIAASGNQVTGTNDPTAHAEIVAIREACSKTGNFFLEDAEIFCSCEPCPMCLGAIYWAHIKTIYYSANRQDAAQAGFDDSFIYNEIEAEAENRKIPIIRIKPQAGKIPFDSWAKFNEKIPY